MGDCQGESCSNAAMEQVRKLAESYRGKEGCLIQVLHAAQGIYGYLPLEVQEVVASTLDVPLPTVSGVVSFYSFFSTEPRGEHNIRVCLGTACYVRGATRVVDKISEHLGIGVGHTTKDRKFTLEVARCIGACGLAPAMTIDDEVYPDMKPSSVPEILGAYYNNAKKEA